MIKGYNTWRVGAPYPSLILPRSYGSGFKYYNIFILSCDITWPHDQRDLTHFEITDTFRNNNLSHFVIPDTICNSNLSHLVIKLLLLIFAISQKSPRNWVLIPFNKIIINIYRPTFLPTLIISLFLLDLWLPYLASWWFKLKDHFQQSHMMLWSRDQVITREMKKVTFPLSWSL